MNAQNVLQPTAFVPISAPTGKLAAEIALKLEGSVVEMEVILYYDVLASSPGPAPYAKLGVDIALHFAQTPGFPNVDKIFTKASLSNKDKDIKLDWITSLLHKGFKTLKNYEPNKMDIDDGDILVELVKMI